MAAFTGLASADVMKESLRFGMGYFMERTLSYERLTLSMYDTRLTAPMSEYSYDYREEAIFVLTGPALVSAWLRYLSEEFGIREERPYVQSGEEVLRSWNFASGAEASMGYPNAAGALARAMRELPYLKVFVAMGLYDAVTPAESVLFSLTRMRIPRARFESDVRRELYEGGHMFYTNPAAKRSFAEDLRNWFSE
jgi:carboxypeptidase C (cathepsin A)